MCVVHCVVVDTNVFAVAERMNDDASEECVLACIQLLRRIEAGTRLGVDSADEIFTEYLKALRTAKTAGLATKLAHLLYRQRRDLDVCHQVDITPIDNPPGSYAEVPAALRNFDLDDQKFLAVATAEGSTPPIYQALDREWWVRQADFTANGLTLQFLCPADLL